MLICFHSSGAIAPPVTGPLHSQPPSTPAPLDIHGKFYITNHLCISLPLPWQTLLGDYGYSYALEWNALVRRCGECGWHHCTYYLQNEC